MTGPSEIDPGLLLGLVALDFGFVTTDDLAAALCDRAARGGSATIGDLLVERGAISPSRRALLEPLVEAHLARCGGDPARGLAALGSSIGSRLEALRSAGAPLAADLSTAAPGPVDSDATRSLDGSSIATGRPGGGRGGGGFGPRFRVVRLHARGGLGQVSLAVDDELDRPVALKEIQDRHADHPASRARFVLEAEITGKLEHPGIVPVYGLGHYEDGRPFYAMRFIQGDSLAEALAQFHADGGPHADPSRRTLALRELLGRFLDVCDAIAYAHSRGVLHRDLKPGNVMLGPFGETLVVDWGLAKPIGGAEPGGGGEGELGRELSGPLRLSVGISGSLPETMAGAAVGTPQYMSPEQARGDLDQLGPASDVYSLGATLYSVLTGRPPVEGRDAIEVLEKVRRGEVEPPRAARPWVPRALDAVCRKSMAIEPAARYESPRALADDLRRFLADEPVAALPEGVVDRLARWTRRHRAAALAGVGVLGVVAVAASISALLINGARLAEARAREAAVTARNREAEARAKTKASFYRAIQLVDRYPRFVSQYAELRGNSPVLDRLRVDLLGQAIGYYRGFVAEYDGDPDFAAEVADAYEHLGRLTRERGQADEALVLSSTAVARHEAALAARPDDPTRRTGLAQALSTLGNAQADSGRAEEAERTTARAVELMAPEAGPGSPSRSRELHSSYLNNLASGRERLGRLDEAEAGYLAALELRGGLVAEAPGSAGYARDLADSESKLGLLLAKLGRPDEARTHHERAAAALRPFVAAEPEVPENPLRLADSLNNLAKLWNEQGRFAQAEPLLAEALDLAERAVATSPDVRGYRQSLGSIANNLGMARRPLGRLAEAERAYGRAREVLEQVVAANPLLEDPRDVLATACGNLANLYAQSGRGDQSLPLFARAIELQEGLAAANPAVPHNAFVLARTRSNLGVAHSQAGRPAEAEQAARQAIDGLARLAADHPNAVDYRWLLGRCWANLGNAQFETGQLAEAQASLESSRAQAAALADLQPDNPGFLADLGAAELNLGASLRQQGRADEGLARTDDAIGHLAAARAKAPRVQPYRMMLDSAYVNRAETLRGLGRAAEAAGATERRRALWPGDPVQQLEAARELALCIPIDPAGAEARAAEVLAALRDAAAAGLSGASKVDDEPAFDPLRDRPEFAALRRDLAFPARPFAP